MATHKCIICGVGKPNALMRATWKNRSQLALFLSILMQSDDLELEKAKSIYSASIEKKSGKVFCHEHARSAASYLLEEAGDSLEDPRRLREHLRVALDITIPRGVNVVPLELLQRLQRCVEKIDKQIHVVMLNIVHFIIESSSRYGLDALIEGLADDESFERRKRKGDFKHGEVLTKSLRLEAYDYSERILNADAEQSGHQSPNSVRNMEEALEPTDGPNCKSAEEAAPTTSEDAMRLLSRLFTSSSGSDGNFTNIKEERTENLLGTPQSALGVSQSTPSTEVPKATRMSSHNSNSFSNSIMAKKECPDNALKPSISGTHRPLSTASQEACSSGATELILDYSDSTEDVSSLKKHCGEAEPSTSKCNGETCKGNGDAEKDQLKELFKFCPNCGSRIEYDGNSYCVRTVEMVPIVSICCSSCCNSKTSVASINRKDSATHSMPRAHAEVIRMAIAAATTGVRISSLLRFSKEANVDLVSKSTFHDVFEKLGPSIERVYKKHQLDTFEVVRAAYEADFIRDGWDISVTYSHHSSKFCSGLCKVVAVDLKTKLCLHSEVLHVPSSGYDSTKVKHEGLRFIIYWFADRGLRIRSVCVDGTPWLGRVVLDLNKQLSWKMEWHIDTRQFAQHVCERVQKISKKRGFGILKGWIKPLRAHIGYSARAGYATGDAKNIKFIFNTFLYHVAGIHEWKKDNWTGNVTECGHGNIEYDGLETIPLGSVAHRGLRKIMLLNYCQMNLPKLSPFGGDTRTEMWNALDHMYCPKEIYLTPETYSAYLYLSSLHLNTVTLAEIRGEEDFDPGYLLKGEENGELDRMPPKMKVVHNWRRDICKDYFAARHVDMGPDTSAEDDDIDHSMDQFESDLEEFYPDVPQLYRKSDYVVDAMDSDSDDCDMDEEDI
ncbi:hypothetical protein Y032_0002g974 [Ancylostoma ceylanicum]|uniref:Uncharacterized protein n=1 Tax=Ancylostoma ceylanicum TaxID=53326 RepID=A0A016W283_9BILA|nr:hypothetical protein Y032_0002g974 [Ancylostoma ceylanicum]